MDSAKQSPLLSGGPSGSEAGNGPDLEGERPESSSGERGRIGGRSEE